MKALVLAAGAGSRLGLKDIPKPMYRIGGKPVLEHNVLLLKKHRVDDICINLYHLPGAIEKYFGDGSKWGVKIQYSFEKEMLGTSGAVKNVEWFWNNNSFFVVYGDNYTDIDLTSMYKRHETSKSIATICVFDPKKVENSGIFGGFVTMDENNRLISFTESNQDLSCRYVNAGVYILEPEILNIIPKNKPSDFGSEIFPMLIESGYLVKGYETNSFVIALDTKEALEKAEILTGKKGGD